MEDINLGVIVLNNGEFKGIINEQSERTDFNCKLEMYVSVPMLNRPVKCNHYYTDNKGQKIWCDVTLYPYGTFN